MNPVRVICEIIELITLIIAAWWFYIATQQHNRSEFWRSLALLMFVMTLSGRYLQTISKPATWATISFAIASIMALVGFTMAHRERKARGN